MASGEEAYMAVLRALSASNQINWVRLFALVAVVWLKGAEPHTFACVCVLP